VNEGGRVGAEVALVTGAAGFVGAGLVRRLLSDGHDVHAVTSSGGDGWRLRGVDVERHELDLRDRAAVARLISGVRPTWVFHLAAHGAYSWQTDAARAIETNALGTVHLVDACIDQDVRALVHAGSSSEYGFKPIGPTERELLEPTSPYAVGKAAASLYCRAVAVERDRHLCTLRLYSVYGPWEEPNRLIPTLLAHALRGELPPLVAPDTARDFVYVEDVCDAFVRTALREDLPRGTILNVGTGVQSTLRDVVEHVRRILDVRAEPAWGAYPARMWDTSCWVADARQIQAQLGWRATTAVAEGLERSAAWLRSAGRATERYA
jgi:dolichol-phosphate mannosyltransferase